MSIGQRKIIFQAKEGGMDPLSPEDHHTCRKGVGILWILASERPDIMCVLKKLSTKLAGPVESDMELLRYTAKYLKGSPELALVHKGSYLWISGTEVKKVKRRREMCTRNKV